MRIVMICNGLGHQTFQYIFARWLEEASGENVLLNDMQFSQNYVKEYIEGNQKKQNKSAPDEYVAGHNGYEIDYVFPNSKKLLKLSEYFEPDIWEYMIKKSSLSNMGTEVVAEFMLAGGVDMNMLIEYDEYQVRHFKGTMYYSPTNRYNSDLARLPGNVYYRGGWFNGQFLNDYRETILKDLEFRPVTSKENLEYENEIKNSFAVGVHIRRGDFIKLKRLISPETYKKHIEDLKKNPRGCKIFCVFQ